MEFIGHLTRMKTFLHFIYFVLAFSVVCSLPPRQFHFIYEKKTWAEAQRYCRDTFKDLATVESMEDVEYMNSLADLNRMNSISGYYVAWNGLLEPIHDWKWSYTTGGYYQGGEAEFRNWESGQPDDYGSRESCVIMEIDGTWADVPCESAFSPVCFDVNGQNSTFVKRTEILTFSEAQSLCRKFHTDLASVRNMAENELINQLQPTGELFWIGLYRDPWDWSDGTKFSFQYWNTDQPNGPEENCGVTNFNAAGKWEDWYCPGELTFVCYSDPVLRQVVKVKLISSSPDLNLSTVQDDLLEQLKLRLKDQGLQDDVKLSWRTQPDGQIFHKEKKN